MYQISYVLITTTTILKEFVLLCTYYNILVCPDLKQIKEREAGRWQQQQSPKPQNNISHFLIFFHPKKLYFLFSPSASPNFLSPSYQIPFHFQLPSHHHSDSGDSPLSSSSSALSKLSSASPFFLLRSFTSAT